MDEPAADIPKIINVDFSDYKKRKQSFLPGSLLSNEEDNKKFKWSRCVSFVDPEADSLKEKATATTFLTGSKYIGQFNSLGMAGKGIYKYPHGVIYDGQFNRNGQFHGSGVLIYPNGHRVQGFWHEGRLTSKGLGQQDWLLREDYCRMPDRRFQREVESGLEPAVEENLTNDPVPRPIPEGCYDTGEGFYDPKMSVIRHYENATEITAINETEDWLTYEKERFKEILELTKHDMDLLKLIVTWRHHDYHNISALPSVSRCTWIKNNCRKAWDEPTGYRPDIYEHWTSGSAKYQIVDSSRNSEESCSSLDSSIFTPCFQSLFSIIPTTGASSMVNDSQIYPKKSKSPMMFFKEIKADVLNHLLFKRLNKHSSSAAEVQKLSELLKPRKFRYSKHLLPKV